MAQLELESPIDRLLSYEDLRACGITYNRQHLWRLYRQGKFPKPIRLSAVRCAWRVSDIKAWIDARARASERVA